MASFLQISITWRDWNSDSVSTFSALYICLVCLVCWKSVVSLVEPGNIVCGLFITRICCVCLVVSPVWPQYIGQAGFQWREPSRWRGWAGGLRESPESRYLGETEVSGEAGGWTYLCTGGAGVGRPGCSSKRREGAGRTTSLVSVLQSWWWRWWRWWCNLYQSTG